MASLTHSAQPMPFAHLADVASIFNGKTPAKADQRTAGHPVLKIRDVDENGTFRGRFESFVDQEFAEQFPEKHLRLGDTLILNAAHNADYVGSKTYYAQAASVDALITGEWLTVRPCAEKLDTLYANHWLRSREARQSIRDLVKGIHLYPKDVARLEIPLPPLADQKRIAAILDATDALRAKRRAALAKLNTLAQSIFVEMFGDPRTNPMGWAKRPCSELCDRITVGIVVKPASYYKDHGVVAIRGTNIKAEGIDLSDVVHFAQEDNDTLLAKTKLKTGDVVLVRSGRPGLAAVVPEALHGANAIDVLIATPNQQEILPRFLRDLVNSPSGKAIVLAESKGQVQQHFNVGSLSSAELTVPPLAQQQAYCDRLDSIEAIRDKALRSMTQIEQLFAGLQHRAFRGELTSNDQAEIAA